MSMFNAGDVIRFKHAESGGWLTVDDEVQTKNNSRQAYVRVVKGQNKEDMEDLSTN
jgi:hypothetical protein